MIISMVVLNYNDAELTFRYVNTIQKFQCIDHILVVDNCSTDNSYEFLGQLRNSKVDIIQTPSNGGYASGNNFGVRYLQEKYGDDGYVIISNPDIIIDEQTIKALQRSFENNHNQFAATGVVHNLLGERIPLYIWKLPTSGMVFAYSSVILRKVLWRLFSYGKRYSPKEIVMQNGVIIGDCLPGCFFMVDMKKFLQLGMFSESTFLYYEEEILFSKAKELGFVSCVIPNTNIVHAEGVSTKKNIRSWAKREYIMEDSCVVYQAECLGKGKILLILYRMWNRMWMPERYFFSRIKEYLKGMGNK